MAFTSNRLAKTSFDYVICGAGSAGCALVRRISQNFPDASIALVETGPPDHPMPSPAATGGLTDAVKSFTHWQTHMPAALTFNLASDVYNWDFWTTKQEGLGGRSIHQPRGKTLGGSSALNAMVYVRGHALDFERWKDSHGLAGWGYADCLPYFKRAQSHSEGGNAYRGADGPLNVKTVKDGDYAELFDTFVEAGVQAGYAASSDLNGAQQEGFGPLDMTISPDGTRCSTANAYLRPALADDAGHNVTVFTSTSVTGLTFDPVDKTRVTGVEVTAGSSGGRMTLSADREVVSCMGAIGSPQLLMLSGIGDGDALADVGIESRVHLPGVGANLQDHSEVYLQYKCSKEVTLFDIATWHKPHKRIAAGLKWFLTGTGPCASNQFETGGFIRSSADVAHPDVQFHFIPGAVLGQLDFLPFHAFQAHVGTLRPRSRGTVRLASADPLAAPLIDPAYYSAEGDLEDLRRALRLTVEIMEQPAFEPYVERRLAPIPKVDLDNDDHADKFIRANTHSAYHPSCTCAMGSVVDETGRVHGVKGLRVVDASIMPDMVSGNLNASTIMIAEKLADDICGLPPLSADHQPWAIPADPSTQRGALVLSSPPPSSTDTVATPPSP